MNIEANKYYTLAEAARALLIDPRTLKAWLKNTKAPLITVGAKKEATRHIVKGKHLLKYVK